MRAAILFFLLFISDSSFAQQYNASLISDSLRENANAVKRNEELRIIIKSPSKAIVKHHYAITILNEAGAAQAQYENNYSKMQSLESVSGKLYNASGKEIRTVKKKDISDFSANDESSLMTDDRMKRHNFYYSQYPYTVEYEDEVKMDGIFFLPSWHPVEDVKLSTEQSSFIVETPADFNLRYKQVVFADAPVTETKGDKKLYSWQLKDLKAVVEEPYRPSFSDITPAVYIAPAQFEIEGYKGDMTTWGNLGMFINRLNADRQQLPENIKQDVHRLTDNVTDQKEKINILYNYMQQNTRYISIQLGIGSWQPFDANYVATKKYGDCKALSNYMLSLLKEAGIKANYVLISAGGNRKRLWEDFPSPYFNHAIICVPQKKDSIWLECTSQTASAGYMGSFTGDRKALLIDNDGGHVIQTPAYRATDNLQLRKIIATVDEKGTLKANVYTHFTGIQQEDAHDLMYGATLQQKQRYLNSMLALPTYSIEKFEYKEKKAAIPEMEEWLSVTAPSYATITGKRFFITPNFFNRSSAQLSKDDERKYDIEFDESFIDADTIQINIPADYSVEAMPGNLSLKSPYGSYSISFELKNNNINLIRRNERNEGIYPKAEYDAVAAYLNQIYKADRSRIVLVKK